MRNICVATEAAGGNKYSIVKIHGYLLTIDDFSRFNDVYRTHFELGQYPAHTCVAVQQLPSEAKIEVEAVAIRDEYI
ncbi:RidA family protein [Shewanella baltica]|uniref:RidA family protein n=1 Tax=Shewanella baltica TaxID=62322 RepID=UPI002870CB6F|nr:RidA family protein [Shewanella baltica]MDR9767885.1 RidA family protein [Shewanella baltica]